MQTQGFLDLIFDAAPHLEYFFFIFLSPALKRHLLKRHLTLSECFLPSKSFHPSLSNEKSTQNFSQALQLSGPLNWLNAILSLLQPLDRYRTLSAIEGAIGEALSRLNHLGGSTAR